MTRKIIDIIIASILLLITNSVLLVAAQENHTNFKLAYEDISKDYTERFFLGDEIVSDKEINHVVSLYKWREVINNPVNYARVQYLEAFLYCYGHSINISEYEQIMNLTDEALKVLTMKKYPAEYSKLLYLRGVACLRNDLPESAYRYFNGSLQYFEKKETYWIYTISIYNRLAHIWRDLEKYDEALEALEKSMELSIKYRGNPDYYLDANMLNTLIAREDYDEVITRATNNLKLEEIRLNKTLLFLQYQYLGDSYSKKNKPDSALYYYNQALGTMTDELPNLRLRMINVLFNIGKIYFEEGEYDKANELLESAAPVAAENQLKAIECEIYYMLYKIYEIQHDKEQAGYYMAKTLEARTALDQEIEVRKIKTNRSKIDIIRYQEDLRLNAQKAKTTQAYAFVVALALFLVLIIILFVLFYINRKKKLKELENERLTQKLKNEELRSRWEKAEHEREIAQKEREMTTSKLLINEKNKIYELMLKTIKPYYDNNKVPVKLWNTIHSLTKSGEQNEKDWHELKVHFEKVHPDFYKKLKTLSSELTEYELRICSYIRISMGAKQIASMLMVNHHSVITSRYRIRKKLGLGKEQSLDDFIRNI